MSSSDSLQRALEDAEEMAVFAHAKWRAAPQGAKGPYWYKVWEGASQQIVRITRAMRMEGTQPKTLDEELDAVLS